MQRHNKRPNWLDGPVRLGLYGIIHLFCITTGTSFEENVVWQVSGLISDNELLSI